VSDPSLVRFRAVLQSALAHLESRREEVNDLNVFPVADGDTGDNMALTLRACVEQLDRLAALAGERTIDDIGRDEIVDSVARAALLGARGNSGVILSQLIRGAAQELISRPGELVDPVLVGAAMARAAQRAYDSVREPAEGTMLTVMRDMAARVAVELAHMPRPRLYGDTSAEAQDAALADVLEQALEAGEESVRRGPELLEVLRRAGVVDAGGYAVTVLLAGVVAALRGEAVPEPAHRGAAARVTRPEHRSSTYRWCTNFAVTGAALRAQDLVPELEGIGDSVLVVGDEHTLKVHVHTDDAERAIGLGEAVGAVSHLDVADMREQVARAEARRRGASEEGGDRGGSEFGAPDDAPAAEAVCGLLAVVAGAGMADLFASLGADVVDGGRTLNPSTHELQARIHAVAAEEVVVLPNSANVVMAAERAADLSEKVVRVVPARSPQAGLAAAVALVPGRTAAENAAAMTAALARVRTGGVAPAAREDPRGRFAAGEAVGYVDDGLVAWGEPEATLRAVLAALADGAELVTCLCGEDAPLPAADVAALAPDDVELELSDAGQGGWWWLLAAE